MKDMNSTESSESHLLLTTNPFQNAPSSPPELSPKLFHTLGQHSVLFERSYIYLLSTMDQVIQRFDLTQILKYGFNDSSKSFSFTYLFHGGQTKQFKFKSPLYREMFDTLNDAIQHAIQTASESTKSSLNPPVEVETFQPAQSNERLSELLPGKSDNMVSNRRQSTMRLLSTGSTPLAFSKHDQPASKQEPPPSTRRWLLSKSKSYAQLSTKGKKTAGPDEIAQTSSQVKTNKLCLDDSQHKLQPKKSFAKLWTSSSSKPFFPNSFLNLFKQSEDSQDHESSENKLWVGALVSGTLDRRRLSPQMKMSELPDESNNDSDDSMSSSLRLEGPVTIYGTEQSHILIKNFKDNQQIVSAGSLTALIDCIYKEPLSGFADAFLLTYRYYVTPSDLLLKLRGRFLELRSLAKRQKTHKFSDTPQQLPLVLMHRIVRFVKKWMETQPFDFLDSGLLTQFYGFQAEIEAFFGSSYFESMKSTFESLVQDGPFPNDSTGTYQGPQKTPDHDYGFSVEEAKFIMTSSAKHIAESLTLIDFELASRIKPYEFIFYLLSQNESSPEKEGDSAYASRCAHLVDFIHRFNRVGFWVASVICSIEPLKARSAILAKFIRIAQYCIHFGNFNTALAIISGLNNSAVLRLKSTFGNLPFKVTSMLKEIESHFDFQGNYRIYRDLENQAKPPYIPFFGLIVKDLYSLNETTPKYTSSDLINFDRSWQLYGIIQRFMSCLAEPFKFSSPAVDFPQIADFSSMTIINSEQPLELAADKGIDVTSNSDPNGKETSESPASYSEPNGEIIRPTEAEIDGKDQDSSTIHKVSYESTRQSRSNMANSYFYVLPYLSQNALNARSHHIQPPHGASPTSPLSIALDLSGDVEDSQSKIPTILEEREKSKENGEDSSGFMTRTLSRLGSNLEEVMTSLGNASKRLREMAEFSGHQESASTGESSSSARPSSRIFRRGSQSKRLSATLFRQMSFASMSTLFHVNTVGLSPSLDSAQSPIQTPGSSSFSRTSSIELPLSPETPLTAYDESNGRGQFSSHPALFSTSCSSETSLSEQTDMPKEGKPPSTIKVTIGTQTSNTPYKYSAQNMRETSSISLSSSKNTGPVAGLLDVLDAALLKATQSSSDLQAIHDKSRND